MLLFLHLEFGLKVLVNAALMLRIFSLHFPPFNDLTCYKKLTILQLLLLPYFLERCFSPPEELCFYICERPIQFAWISQKRWFIELPSHLLFDQHCKMFCFYFDRLLSGCVCGVSQWMRCQVEVSELYRSSLRHCHSHALKTFSCSPSSFLIRSLKEMIDEIWLTNPFILTASSYKSFVMADWS